VIVHPTFEGQETVTMPLVKCASTAWKFYCRDLTNRVNSVKVLGVFLDQLCINPGGKKDMGLVVFPECAHPVVQLAVKRLLDQDLLEDPLREVGRDIDEVLTFSFR